MQAMRMGWQTLFCQLGRSNMYHVNHVILGRRCNMSAAALSMQFLLRGCILLTICACYEMSVETSG